MRKGMTVLLAAVLAAPGAASFNQDPPVRLTDEQVLALVDKDQRMAVPVQIGGGGPWNFVIDTGAQRTVISRELANVLKLAPGPEIRLTDMAGTSVVRTARIPSLTFGTLGQEAIDAPALAAQHLGAPGMLGVDALQGRKVSIDFERGTMTVVPASRRLRDREAHDPDEVVVRARSYLGQLVVGNATFGGHAVKIILDTGTPVTIGNEALGRLVAKGGLEQLKLTSVTGSQLQVGYTRIGRVAFGGLEIANLPVAFAAAAPFRQFRLDRKPALLLGMDALGLFRRVDIDFANRELRLLRPKAGATRT